MIIKRVWEMPNRWTFKMKCVQELLLRYIIDNKNWIDPFAGLYPVAGITNDIEQSIPSKYHMDGLQFLKSLQTSSADGCTFDPPYSTEQCLRIYSPSKASHGGTCGRAEYWAKCKDEIARIVKQKGIVISFGWDTTGIGKTRGFEVIEILDICHGACHNDTLVTVEKQAQEQGKVGVRS